MLSIWLPLNKDIRNQGLTYSEPTGSYEIVNDGLFGKCIHTTSAGSISTLIKSVDGWDISTKSCGFGAWLKFNLNEMKAASAYSYTSTNNIIHNVVLGWNSYGGFSMDLISNNIYSVGSFTGASIQPHIRFGSNYVQTSAKPIVFDEWHHWFLQYSKEGNCIELYYDGVRFSTASTTSVTISTLAQNFMINNNTIWGGNNPGKYLPYYVSDVRVYDHELKDWEIKKIANAKVFDVDGGLHLEAAYNSNAASNKLLTETAYNGAISKYGYNDASNLKKETVVVDNVLCDKITARSGNTSFYPYVFFSPLHPLSGAYKTLSFDYYPTSQDKIIPYTYGGNANVKWVSNYSVYGNSNNANSVTIPVNVNKWNHLDITLQGVSTATTGWGYIRIGTAKHTANLSNYWLFKNIQITELDHPIEYTYENRDERFVDLSGFDNEVTPYNITQSGSSLYFNGVGSAIKIPMHEMISGGTWSINLWFYRPNGEFGTKTWETLVGGPSGFELEATSSSTKTLYVCPYSWGGGKFAYEADRWNMVTLTRTSSGSKLYINGSLVKSGSAGSMPSGDYFIGAWKTATQQNFKGYIKKFSVFKKCLSDDDVMSLYIHGK